MFKEVIKKVKEFWEKYKEGKKDNLDFTDAMLGIGDIPVTVDENKKIHEGNILVNKNKKKIEKNEKDKKF